MILNEERNEIIETIMYAIDEIDNGQEESGIKTLEELALAIEGERLI